MRASYRLSLSVHAVRSSRQRHGGILIELAAGSILEREGESKISGLVDVRCSGQIYSVFPQDLEARAEQLDRAILV